MNIKATINMLLDQKILGGILLIVGTCLGGAMLALPISNASAGFTISSGYLFLIWFSMSFCSYLILEVNLLFKPGTNLLTMSSKTLGWLGKIITIIAYFALLYNLLAAYIAGGSGIIFKLAKTINLPLSTNISTLLFIMIFGGLVFGRMKNLDIANKSFIMLKLILLVAIIFLSLPVLEVSNLLVSNALYSKSLIVLLCTSFGFGVVIPSLRTYLGNDPNKLRLTVIVGSFIPLLVYLVWDAVIMGVIGTEMLINLADDKHMTNSLMDIFAAVVQNRFAVNLFNIFSAVCLITSFFGISLSMSDFLADSTNIAKKGTGQLWLFALTFLPPLVLVIWFQEGFMAALKYAGVCCIVLHILLPICMAFRCINSFGWSDTGKIWFRVVGSLLLIIFSYITFFGA